MKKICSISAQPFEISAEEVAQLQKLSPIISGERYQIPLPTLAPSERRRRRILFRNERKLYHRKCSLTGKEIISMYSPDKNFPVYAQAEWWSDKWDALSYGREFNFSMSFFDQFSDLLNVVPRVALINSNSLNCEYTNLAADNKNCYILIESSNNQDCYYSYWMQRCNDCIDCAFCYDCELCYEVTDCFNCYNVSFSSNSKNCNDCSFIKNCQSCSNCFACINLRNKSYCFFNEQLTKEEYFSKIKSYNLATFSTLESAKIESKKFFLTQPHKFAQISNIENCTGNYITNSKNCQHCFHAFEAEDCRYGVHVWRNSKDNMDVDTCGRDAELNYECVNTGIEAYNNLFCYQCWTASNLIYCISCHASRNCFGCVGLRNKEYCILNKQYSKNEYEQKVAKIIEQMNQSREWGEFFPASLSPFGYNETSAQEAYPLTKEQAIRRGYQWKDEDMSSSYKGKIYEILDNISDVEDDITRYILTCSKSHKPYKVISQELAFYKKVGISVPRLAPDARHLARMAERPPMNLWARNCKKCNSEIISSYSTERQEQIYCEKCYESIIY